MEFEELIKDYLNRYGNDNEFNVVRITPFILNDEQHYRVEYRNDYCETGFDNIDIELADLLISKLG